MKQSANKKIPFRQTLFWDVNPREIDPDKNAEYVIERVLDFGNKNEVRWLFNYYPHRQIKHVLSKSRVIHDKSKSLWPLVLQN